MENLISKLREFDALRDEPNDGPADTVLRSMLPSVPPTPASESYLEKFPESFQSALAAMDIQRLYSHQEAAIEAICAGNDVVLEAPTGSGKTLCFNIPLARGLLNDQNSHALMIHPMKALSNDQRRQFEALAEHFSTQSHRRLDSWVYDGDLDH